MKSSQLSIRKLEMKLEFRRRVKAKINIWEPSVPQRSRSKDRKCTG